MNSLPREDGAEVLQRDIEGMMVSDGKRSSNPRSIAFTCNRGRLEVPGLHSKDRFVPYTKEFPIPLRAKPDRPRHQAESTGTRGGGRRLS